MRESTSWFGVLVAVGVAICAGAHPPSDDPPLDPRMPDFSGRRVVGEGVVRQVVARPARVGMITQKSLPPPPPPGPVGPTDNPVARVQADTFRRLLDQQAEQFKQVSGVIGGAASAISATGGSSVLAAISAAIAAIPKETVPLQQWPRAVHDHVRDVAILGALHLPVALEQTFREQRRAEAIENVSPHDEVGEAVLVLDRDEKA